MGLCLAGDIGGTNTRLKLFDGEEPASEERRFPSPKYGSLEEIVREFLSREQKKVSTACFGVAGPVREGRCKTTNLPWIIDAANLSKELGIPRVGLLNDLEANAYGIKQLKSEDLCLLNPVTSRQIGNQALIAAGTGLGEAGLYWNGIDHCPFASEGGHTDFAPRNAMEIELLVYLRKKWGHVSYERIVSGPGIHSLYQFLIDTGRETPLPEVEALMQRGNPSKVITELAMANKDVACANTLDWFISIYGAEAGNLALKLLALGGVYVGGGIAPYLVEKMKKGKFISAFVDKGRFKPLLESIPVWVILNEDTALLGAAARAKLLSEGV